MVVNDCGCDEGNSTWIGAGFAAMTGCPDPDGNSGENPRFVIGTSSGDGALGRRGTKDFLLDAPDWCPRTLWTMGIPEPDGNAADSAFDGDPAPVGDGSLGRISVICVFGRETKNVSSLPLR